MPRRIRHAPNHVLGPEADDRSRLHESHEAAPTDPSRPSDLGVQIVAGAELDPMEQSATSGLTIEHLLGP